MIFGGRKGAALLSIRKGVFERTINLCTISVPFLSKLMRMYDFGGCAPLPQNFFFFAS